MRSASPASGSVAAAFLAPVLELLSDCLHTRHCPALPDEAWVHLGLQRVLHELPSGRAFLHTLRHLALGIGKKEHDMHVLKRLDIDIFRQHAPKGRKQKTFAKAQEFAAALGRKIPSPVVALQRFTQHSVKLLRWLRSSFADRLDWDAATPRLRVLYATL